ncbi:hypothetical protein GF318_00955 [Candidatus Micrarchaeota archaeon]|nr:hypothetical protein [Candidatus Micrarchaeota archaeon]
MAGVGGSGKLFLASDQLLFITTVGRAVDRFFKKIAKRTGLKKLGKK